MTALNFDVLRLICGFLTDVSTVLSFSFTCSTLRPVAVERRLSMRPVTIHSPTSLQDLYNFIVVDQRARGPHIHAIIIPVHASRQPPDSSEELVDCLLAVLASATRVRTLSLCEPGEPSILFSHPRFLAAVAEMSGLQELSMVAPAERANNRANELLASTCSALKMFRHAASDTSMWDNPYRDISLLSSIGPQLTVTLEEVEWPFTFLVAASRSSVSLPGVRSVTLTATYYPFWVDMLLAVFPSLDRNLTIQHYTPTLTSSDLVYLKEDNREAQRTRGWKGVDRVSGGPLMLLILGLACLIHHLTISRPDLEYTRAVLEEYTPTHLAFTDLEISASGFAISDYLFPPNAVARLTHLVLVAAYTNKECISLLHPRARSDAKGYPSWDVILGKLLESGLKCLRLTHVHIVIRCDINLQNVFSEALYDGVRSFKFDRLVASLPTTIPSLTHIFITSSGRSYTAGEEKGEETWQTSKAWRVRRPCVRTHVPGGTANMHELEELSTTEREAAIEREQMRATERIEWIVE